VGTQAGFTFAPSSVGWIFFAHLPTCGFLKHGGRPFWGSTGGPEGEVPVAMPPSRAEALGRNPASGAAVRAVPRVWSGLEENKQASS